MRGLTLTDRAVWALLAAVAMVAAVVPFAALPALAGQNTFIEVNPSTVQAGSRVSLRGSCEDNNTQQAEVRSDAFGRVVLRPDNGFLTGAVTVPSNRAAGDYGVDLRCQNGNTASTTLTVLNMTQPTKGPATGGGGTADHGTRTLLLASGVAAIAMITGFGMLGMRRRRPETRP